ncbi:hypothetical protein GCM10027605_30730 [Micromonospora zhanjiangensis]
MAVLAGAAETGVPLTGASIVAATTAVTIRRAVRENFTVDSYLSVRGSPAAPTGDGVIGLPAVLR